MECTRTGQPGHPARDGCMCSQNYLRASFISMLFAITRLETIQMSFKMVEIIDMGEKLSPFQGPCAEHRANINRQDLQAPVYAAILR